MIKQGLRAKLKTISLVTGKRYVDLAIYKNTIAVYQDHRGKYLEIPTLPSDMHQMQKVLEDMDLGQLYHKVLGTFESLDTLSKNLSLALSHKNTQKLVNDLVAASESLNRILSKIDAGVDPIFEKVDRELDDINTLTLRATTMVTTFDQHIQPLAASVTNTLNNLDNTLLQTDSLLKQAEQTLQPSSPLYHRLSETLRQLESTSSSIKQLSDFISRNPDALIFGLQQTGEINEQK
jgi:paraquat-inducible protein B